MEFQANQQKIKLKYRKSLILLLAISMVRVKRSKWIVSKTEDKPKTVNITEKSSSTIAPTRIDKELLMEIGEILKQECKEDCEVSIELYSDSKDIETEDSKAFQDVPIPADTYEVSMGIISYEDYNPVEIEIDTKKPKNCKIRVMGKNATWVRGASRRLTEAFEKKKLGYRHIAKYESIRLLMSMVASALLSYVGGFVLWYSKFFEPFYVMLFVVAFFYAMSMLVKRFFDWLFPYFEIGSEDFKPRKFRKIALAILWGSGILPTILFRLFGLS